jgi:hypothetical protein
MPTFNSKSMRTMCAAERQRNDCFNTGERNLPCKSSFFIGSSCEARYDPIAERSWLGSQAADAHGAVAGTDPERSVAAEWCRARSAGQLRANRRFVLLDAMELSLPLIAAEMLWRCYGPDTHGRQRALLEIASHSRSSDFR